MAIAAQRFAFLDKETNVPVTNFVTSSTSDILSSPEYDILSITDELKSLTDLDKIDDVNSVLQKVNEAETLGTSRITKDFFSSITSITDVAANKVSDLVMRYFPSDAALKSAFLQIGEKCKASILAGLGNCKNKKHKASFKGLKLNANNRSCNLNAFVNLINKFAGGLYNLKLVDQCALVRLVAGMASRGFDLGLPKVFSAISGQIEDKFLLAQAGVTVMGSAALSRNMEAVIDVASSSVGHMLTSINPGLTSMVMANYAIPGELKDFEISAFQDRFSSAMKNMDSNWNSMNFISNTTNGLVSSNIPSLAKMDTSNEDLLRAFQCGAYDSNSALPSLDGEVPTPSDNDYLLAGMTLDDSDANKSLTDNFDYLYSIGKNTDDVSSSSWYY